MKAYVSEVVKGGIHNPQARGHLTTDNTVVSNDYQTYHALQQRVLKGKPAGRYHIEAWYNWSRRFEQPADYEAIHHILH